MVDVVIHPQEIDTAVTAMDGLDVGYPDALNIGVCIYLKYLLLFIVLKCDFFTPSITGSLGREALPVALQGVQWVYGWILGHLPPTIDNIV